MTLVRLDNLHLVASFGAVITTDGNAFSHSSVIPVIFGVVTPTRSSDVFWVLYVKFMSFTVEHISSLCSEA